VSGTSLTGWAKRTSGDPTTDRARKKIIKKVKFYEFGRKFIDIRKIIFILAETTWDIVPKHY